MAERLNALVLKTSMRLTAYRGFESLPLRSTPQISLLVRAWQDASVILPISKPKLGRASVLGPGWQAPMSCFEIREIREIALSACCALQGNQVGK